MTASIENNNIVCVSGAFDLLHLGHLRLFNGAQHFGKLIVILNSDKFIHDYHGHKPLMSFNERKEMLSYIKGINDIVSVEDSDGTVCEAIKRIRPFAFANGGNHWKDNTPEYRLCKELDIVVLWGIGGGIEQDYTFKMQMIYKA